MDEGPVPFRPPYFSFQTFWGFIDELAARPLPPQIDRSMMGSKSGTDQANLLTALKGFDLIGPDQRVNSTLTALAAQDAGERKAALAALVRHFYAAPLAVSELNGTEGQLNEAFKAAYSLESGDTRRKAITFFLHAARTAGIELSPYFPATRGGTGSGSGSPGVPRPKKRAAGKAKTNGTVGPASAPGSPGAPVVTTTHTVAGEVKTVSFGDAGTVTVNVNVRWLDLPDEAFVGVRRIIRELEAFGTATDQLDASASMADDPETQGVS